MGVEPLNSTGKGSCRGCFSIVSIKAFTTICDCLIIIFIASATTVDCMAKSQKFLDKNVCSTDGFNF